MFDFAEYLHFQGYNDEEIEKELLPIFELKYFVSKECDFTFENGKSVTLQFLQSVSKDRFVTFFVKKRESRKKDK